MRDAFEQFIHDQLSFLKDKRLLLAVSGGIDSVVLLHLCHELKLNLAVAHCNFKLRPHESDKDEQFVLELGKQLEVEVFTQSFDIPAYTKTHKKSVQMAARELRYDWFKELSDHLGFDYILTAHHADDNLETFIINFMRGTGINGLTGIPFINNNTVRPLLPFSREEITELARSENWDWREDASNATRKYLRNRLRHEVIPVLKEINPSLLSSFKDTLKHLNDTADIVEESLNAVAKRAITHIDDHEVHYKISEFKKVNNPKAYLHEMFKSYGFREWQDVVDLLDAQSGKLVLSDTHRLIKHRDVLILTDRKITEQQSYSISESDLNTEFPLGKIVLKWVAKKEHGDQNSIFINKTLLEFPLTLRIWEPGDFFIPSGMHGKKKLSKYLKDEKYSLTEKERTWVLCSGKEIVWVVGKRGDQRFMASESTESVLKIKLIY